MRRLSITLILAISITLIGGYGYIWFQTKQQADRLVEAAAPFADISYGNIYVMPSGTAGIRDVIVRPRIVEDSINIDGIYITTPNLPELLKLSLDISKGKLPRLLTLRVSGISLATDQPIMKMLLDNDGGPGTVGLIPAAVEALACGTVERIGTKELTDMGYPQIINSMEATYRLDPHQRRLTALLRNDIEDIASLALELELELSGDILDPQQVMQAPPRLHRAEVRYSDQGYNQRKIAFCSGQASTDEKTYLSKHQAQATQWLQHQGLPSPALAEAYQRYVQAGSWLSLVLAPETPVESAALALLPLDQMMHLLKPELTIGDSTYTLSELLPGKALKEKIAFKVPTTKTSTPPTNPAVSDEKPAPPKQDFHPVEVDQLNRFMGHTVRIFTDDGKEHQGKLTAMKESTVTIEKRTHGGSFAFQVYLSSIVVTEVFY